MSRVLIVEDNRNLALGLRSNLEYEGYEAEVADDGPTALARARARIHDLILLDHKVRGLRNGADDYVTKPFALRELLARVAALFRRSARRAAAARAPMTFGGVSIEPDMREVTLHGRPVALRPREYDLLCALLDREGRPVGRAELLREVWGYHESVSSRTLDTHIGELRRKLEDDPARPRYILTVRKAGYRLALEHSRPAGR